MEYIKLFFDVLFSPAGFIIWIPAFFVCLIIFNIAFKIRRERRRYKAQIQAAEELARIRQVLDNQNGNSQSELTIGTHASE